MPPETPRPDARSSFGPLLILLAGAAFTAVALWYEITNLRYLFQGVPVRATVTGREDGRTLTFLDRDGNRHVVPGGSIGKGLNEGDTPEVRYLPGDPGNIRAEDDVRHRWRWGLLFLGFGLGVVAFGVLTTWGRRPRRRSWTSPPPEGW